MSTEPKPSTLVYYTHNLAPQALLRETLTRLSKLSAKENIPAIIVSQYQVLEECLDLRENQNEPNDNDIYQYVVKDLRLPKHDDILNCVVGQLPYNSKSIVKQILCALKYVETDNVILFEHDCLYPDNYVDKVNETLSQHDLSIWGNRIFIDKQGYYSIGKCFYLSGYAGKTTILQKSFDRKLSIYSTPFVVEPAIKDFETQFDDRDFFIENHKVIKSENILDVRHKLNSSGCYAHRYVDNMNDYWGMAEQYKAWFDFNLSDSNANKWVFGTSQFGY